MNPIIPITIVQKEETSTSEYYIKPLNSGPIEIVTSPTLPVVEDKRKKGRPKKKTIEDGVEVVTGLEESNKFIVTNAPYIESYDETTSILKNSIAQLDILASETKGDIDLIRASKTLKSKYTYLKDMTASMATMINTKVSAVREINSSITNAHNLELKRIKDINLGSEGDDDKKIMDLYSAFVNTPMDTINNPLGQNIHELTLPYNGIPGLPTMEFDTGYNDYLNNMSPEQNAMRYENNPNMQTVVLFNQDTGERSFEIIDKTTGEPIPNMNKPDSFLFEDITIDIGSQVARNIQLDVSYPVILTGKNNAILEY